MLYTIAQIKEKIATSDAWLLRGLLAIYARQTENEQASDSTREDNGIGFNGYDAPFLSSLVKGYQRYNRLTPRQVQACRKCMMKYAGQLTVIANQKALTVQPSTVQPEHTEEEMAQAI